jgi:hypothetical protein
VTALIETGLQITPSWLGGVLGAEVADVVVTPIGTGQLSQSLRATYHSMGVERHVVVKVAASDQTSRATGVGLGAYAREVEFYRRFADRAMGLVPRCELAEYDPAEGWLTLVLEDLAPAVQGDRIAGCDSAAAELALVALAGVQAPVLGVHALGGSPWLNQPNPLTQALYQQVLPGFRQRFGDRIVPEHRATVEEFAGRVDAWLADVRVPRGMVHGDFRLDNLMFGVDRCTIVDWQTVSWGPAVRDVSYFLGGSLTVADRRAHEQRLVGGYHQRLTDLGARGLGWTECWREYRRQSFFGILMAVIAPMIVQQTERGDRMFMTLLARHAQQVLDLGALELLPPD